MFAGLLGWLASLLTGDALKRVLDIIAKRADTDNALALERIRAIQSEGHDLADLNKTKLQFPWFWVLITLFIGPLGLWWALVIADSIFYFPFDIADLPTPEMRSWAGDMVRWLFYVGSVTAAVKAVAK